MLHIPMASVTKNKGCRYWIACFRDSAGIQRRRTTRETNRAKALEIAKNYEWIVQGRLTARGAREIMMELYREKFGVAVPTATVEGFISNWLKAKQSTISPGAFEVYGIVARKFLRFLGDSAKTDIASITRQHIVSFRDLEVANHSPSTVNSQLCTVKLIFHDAARDGFLSENPAEYVDMVRVPKKAIRQAFTEEQLRAILKVASGKMRSLILFGVYTGQRLGDLCSLLWSNLDMEEGVIRLITSKTQTTLTIPIAAPLREHIATLPVSDDPGAPVHPKAFKTYASKAKARPICKEFALLLAQVGLRDTREIEKGTGKGISRRNPQELTFHCLRHTAVSMLKTAGIPLAVVKEYIGHSSDQISDRYTHVGISSLRSAADSLPRL
jgi:integrase